MVPRSRAYVIPPIRPPSTAPITTAPISKSAPALVTLTVRTVSIVNGRNEPLRSQAPVWISRRISQGATKGFEMFAARYIFRRFSRNTVPAAVHNRR